MAKKTPTNDNTDTDRDFPDPVLFQQLVIPLVDELLKKYGGMENMLKQNPAFAQLALKNVKNLKDPGETWLSNNFPLSPEEVKSSFTRIEQACEQKSTPLGGETDNKTDEVE